MNGQHDAYWARRRVWILQQAGAFEQEGLPRIADALREIARIYARRAGFNPDWKLAVHRAVLQRAANLPAFIKR